VAFRRHRGRCILALVAAFPAALAFAQDAHSPDSQRPTTDDESETSRASWEYTKEQDLAINKGLVFLASQQVPAGKGGFWISEGGHFDVAVTALAGLAFLAHGDQPGRSPRKAEDGTADVSYGDRIERAVNWLVKNQWPDNHPSGHGGLYYDQDRADDERTDRPMHGHGYAMLFLAEAYGQVSDPKLRAKIHESLKRAIKLTETTQSHEGGWFYKPGDGKDEGSVTITQIQGLRAARNAGVSVNKAIIDKAVEYIRRSQYTSGNRAGGVRYTIHYGDPSPALTAAGIAVYYGAGEYGSPGIEKGFEYLSRNMRLDDRTHFWYYTHFYAVQAMYQRGLPEWKSYYTRLRQQLLGARNPEGAWQDGNGPVFATSIAVLCLEVPLGYLPIFQR
jgi:hypothetical protein